MSIVNFNYSRDDFLNKSFRQFFGENKQLKDFGITLEQYKNVENGHNNLNDNKVELKYYAKVTIYKQYKYSPDTLIKDFLIWMYRKASKYNTSKTFNFVNSKCNMLDYILDNFNKNDMKIIGW